jgi:predicted nucleic acid-binding protein
VIDTNIWVSGQLWQGEAWRLLNLAEQGKVELCIALNLCSIFDVSRSGLPIVEVDPDDDIFLLCAIEAQASYVVTHDRHLLALKSYQGIPIVTLADFFQLLNL